MYISSLVYICHTHIHTHSYIAVSIYMNICYTHVYMLNIWYICCIYLSCISVCSVCYIDGINISLHITALYISKRIYTYSLSYAIHLCMSQYNHAGIYIYIYMYHLIIYYDPAYIHTSPSKYECHYQPASYYYYS